MRKGFTLIELLAVIVILAIIALIATPIILGIINDAREEANKRSIELYASAIKNGIVSSELNDIEITPNVYNSSNLPFEVEYDGDVECNIIQINEDKTVTLTDCIVNGESVDYKFGNSIIKGYFYSLCTPSSEQLYSTTPLTEGYKYDCKVDPNKDAYSFFVLEDVTEDSTQIKLIMDSNIMKNGNSIKQNFNTYLEQYEGFEWWISREDYILHNGPNSDSENCGPYGNEHCMDDTLGPITAMNYLNTATNNWSNLKEMKLTAWGNEVTNSSTGIIYNIYARLPFKSELSDYTSKKAYLYEYLKEPTIIDGDGYSWGDKPMPNNSIDHAYGYWAGDSSMAINLQYTGWHKQGLSSSDLDDSTLTLQYVGIRPVIILDL